MSCCLPCCVLSCTVLLCLSCIVHVFLCLGVSCVSVVCLQVGCFPCFLRHVVAFKDLGCRVSRKLGLGGTATPSFPTSGIQPEPSPTRYLVQPGLAMSAGSVTHESVFSGPQPQSFAHWPSALGRDQGLTLTEPLGCQHPLQSNSFSLARHPGAVKGELRARVLVAHGFPGVAGPFGKGTMCAHESCGSEFLGFTSIAQLEKMQKGADVCQEPATATRAIGFAEEYRGVVFLCF